MKNQKRLAMYEVGNQMKLYFYLLSSINSTLLEIQYGTIATIYTGFQTQGKMLTSMNILKNTAKRIKFGGVLKFQLQNELIE